MNDENVKVKFIRRFQKSSKKSRIIFVICLLVMGILLGKIIANKFEKKPEPKIVTTSTLYEIINVSKLSTYQCVYNDICKVMDKDDPQEIAYYCSYEAKVKAGIDFKKVKIEIKENKDGKSVVTVTIPKVELDEPIVDITSLDYMYEENSIDKNTISEEAYKACIEDAKEKSQKEELIIETAQKNAINTVTGLIQPFIEQASKDEGPYELKVVTSEET
jgi:hypothetical protein